MRGFTLIELMIVMTIMGILGFAAFANLGSFREDATLKKAVSDLQTKLRAIQTNASTNTECNGNTALFWKGKLSKSGTPAVFKLETSCEYSGGEYALSDKTYTFEPSIKIGSMSSGNCPTDLASSFVTVSFPALKGNASFKYTDPCTPGSQLKMDLQNIKDLSTLSTLVIDKGGLIYVEGTQ